MSPAEPEAAPAAVFTSTHPDYWKVFETLEKILIYGIKRESVKVMRLKVKFIIKR